VPYDDLGARGSACGHTLACHRAVAAYLRGEPLSYIPDYRWLTLVGCNERTGKRHHTHDCCLAYQEAAEASSEDT
jgi:hypothetical protein